MISVHLYPEYFLKINHIIFISIFQNESINPSLIVLHTFNSAILHQLSINKSF